jgi:hypothetical protein
MTVCHLLLGRPWQYDRDVRHNGKANTHHAVTTMTDTGTYILMATKEDLREFGDDPTAILLVLVYKGEILVSDNNTSLSLGVSTILQESLTFSRRGPSRTTTIAWY